MNNIQCNNLEIKLKYSIFRKKFKFEVGKKNFFGQKKEFFEGPNFFFGKILFNLGVAFNLFRGQKTLGIMGYFLRHIWLI